MTDASFQARLACMGAQTMSHPQSKVQVKARTRHERLAIALCHLEQGGVSGTRAYPLLFQGLSRIGIILKPMHYRSWAGLILFFMVLVLIIVGFTFLAVAFTGVMPRPVQSMITLDPNVLCWGALFLSVIFAALHKVKARKIGLPLWNDI